MITLLTSRLLISLRSSERRDSEDTSGEGDMSSSKLRASAESADLDSVCGSSDIELRDCYAK